MGQVNSTDYNGRHVTSYHIKILGIKFTKKGKKHKSQTECDGQDGQLENVKIKKKKRSLLSYLGKHLKLTKKKNVVKSSSKQVINQNKSNESYGEYNPKLSSPISESVVNELNNKLNIQHKQSNQLNRIKNQPTIKLSNHQNSLQKVQISQVSQPIEIKHDLNDDELDNELTDIPLTDIPLNSETNSLQERKLSDQSINKENDAIDNQFGATNHTRQTEPDTNANRLSATFSTYDLKAQLNNSTVFPTNNKDQQIRLSSMLNRRSFKANTLSPLKDGSEQSKELENHFSTKSSNNVLNQMNQMIRPTNVDGNLGNGTNNMNNNSKMINNMVQKNNFQNKRLLTEATNAISSISTMRNGIILTSGHPKVAPNDSFNAAKNNLQFNEQPPINNNLQPKTTQTSSQTKTIIQVNSKNLFLYK